MTNDELERIMNFIIDRQERTSDQLSAASKQLATLAANQANHEKQLGEHHERIARFERSYTTIADLLAKHDRQLEAVTEGLNKLITTVDRYIAARGNGSGGGGTGGGA